MDQISPLLRRTKLSEELEKVKQWKEEGLTKEEILNRIDRRIVTEDDVEKIFQTIGEEETVVENENNQDIDLNNSNAIDENVTNETTEEVKEEILENQSEENSNTESITNETDLEENKTDKEETSATDEITVEENRTADEFKELKDEELVDFPEQPFKLYDEEKKEEMINSIKINGIIQPLIVRPIEERKISNFIWS